MSFSRLKGNNFNPFPAEKNLFIVYTLMYTELISLRFSAHTGFKIPFATSPHWILFATATRQKQRQHAAVNNFFIIQDKKTTVNGKSVQG